MSLDRVVKAWRRWATTLAVSSLSAITPAAAENRDSVNADKLNHDVSGYNFLAGTFGLSDQYRSYVAQRIGQRSISAPVSVNDGWLDQAQDELKKGSAAQGRTTAELDAAVERMLPVLGRLVERLKGLDAYYTSRGQTADRFARGKREDPLVLADFRLALAAMTPLGEALHVATENRDMAELDRLKQAGDLVGYQGGLALLKAKRLIALFHGPQDVRNTEMITQADRLAAEIQAALAEENDALAAVKTSGDDGNALRNSSYTSAAGHLQQVIGAYRDMKHGGRGSAPRAMIDAYNSAIEEVNIGR